MSRYYEDVLLESMRLHSVDDRPKKRRLKESVEIGSDSALDDAYGGSWYTIEGAGGDLSEWENGYCDMLEKQGIGRPERFVKFTGKQVSDHFGFKGNNRYPDDLTILCFPLDNLDISKLAMFKLQMGDRWFDDIVDNSRRRSGFDESLKEARNPENEKVNHIIRKYEGRDYSFDDYSPKERAVLKKYGIKEDDDYYELVGPNGRRLDARDIQDFDDESYGDFDYANYLAKKNRSASNDPDEERFVVSKSGSGEKHWPRSYGMGRHEHRIPADNRKIGDVEKTGKYGHWNIDDKDYVDKLQYDANYSIKNKDRISRMSQKQFDALQPYAKEKEEILKAGKTARKAQKTLQNAEDKKKQIMKSVQDKKASRKNESLLTEDVGNNFISDVIDTLSKEVTPMKSTNLYVYIDQTGSWGQQEVNDAERILKTITARVKDLDVRVFRVSDISNIVAQIKSNNPDNVMVLTDDDFDYGAEEAVSPLTIRGGVFMLFRGGRQSKKLISSLKGRLITGVYSLEDVLNNLRGIKNESLSLNESSGTEYEIYFSDLTPEAQADLLEFVGIASPKELNWDVYPIAMLFDYSDELEELQND